MGTVCGASLPKEGFHIDETALRHKLLSVALPKPFEYDEKPRVYRQEDLVVQEDFTSVAGPLIFTDRSLRYGRWRKLAVGAVACVQYDCIYRFVTATLPKEFPQSAVMAEH
jgi:hypothetical protein